jgi:hypothetical protein
MVDRAAAFEEIGDAPSLVTSAGIAIAFSRSAMGSSFAALREAMMTSAPSRRASSAVDSPMPDEPPTTTTLFPASCMLFSYYTDHAG